MLVTINQSKKNYYYQLKQLLILQPITINCLLLSIAIRVGQIAVNVVTKNKKVGVKKNITQFEKKSGVKKIDQKSCNKSGFKKWE